MDGAEQLSLFNAATAAQLLTIPEAARVLRVGRSTLYELIADGRIEVVHIGRSARVRLSTLISFVDGLAVAPATTAVPRRRIASAAAAEPTGGP